MNGVVVPVETREYRRRNSKREAPRETTPFRRKSSERKDRESGDRVFRRNDREDVIAVVGRGIDFRCRWFLR